MAVVLPDHLQQIVADENTRRGLAWLAVTPDLCGCPIVLTTPRILFELHFSGNALLYGRPAGRQSIFEFLWRLHPNFRRPSGEMPNTTSGSTILSWLARRWLRRQVARLALWDAEREILGHIANLRQDEPPASSSSRPRGLPEPLPHLLDSWCHWWGSHYGVDPRNALDVPLPLILQCRRTVAIARGDPVIDPSAEKIGQYLFAQHRRN